MAFLSKISIYPIKSLGAIAVPASRIAPGGGLEHDREFAVFDADGKYVNGKRNIKVHRLTAAIDWKDATVSIKRADCAELACFHLHTEIERLEGWLSDYFGQPVSWRRNTRGGFPDDTKAPGPTVIGEATLRTVQAWYNSDRLDVPEVRRRFRANLEIGGTPAFWEDRLYAEADQVVRFRIGDVEFDGTNPCKRCIVPTRDTSTGEQTDDFSNRFIAMRRDRLPEWATRSRFDHYYRLAVNTRISPSEEGKLLRVGDTVEIVGVRQA